MTTTTTTYLPPATPISPALQAFADAMAAWPQRVVDAGVKCVDGRAYRPLPRNVSPLRYIDKPNDLITECHRILDAPYWDHPDAGTKGWNAVIAQAGPQYVWEWLIMDRTAPWAHLFTEQQRWNVAIAIAHTIKRGI